MVTVRMIGIEDNGRARWREVRDIALERCLEAAERLAGIIRAVLKVVELASDQ